LFILLLKSFILVKLKHSIDLSMARKNNKDKVRVIVLERINVLFKLGIVAVRSRDYSIARRYGELIYRISMRLRVKIPRNIKRWICRNCRVIMVPGLNAKIRTRRDGRTLRIITRCMVCGWIHRYEFVKRGEKYGETPRISR